MHDVQGAKLCMLADMLGSTGSLTGVDVAKHRLAACRTMLQKYSLGDRTRLFVADGTLFSLLPVDSVLQRIEGILVLKHFCLLAFLFGVLDTIRHFHELMHLFTICHRVKWPQRQWKYILRVDFKEIMEGSTKD
jgi:hypothetical protein